MSQYLKGGYQERCPFNKQSHGKIMGNGYKLLMGGFQLDTRGKHFKNNQPLEHLLREVMDSPTLDTYKIWLDRVLGHLAYTMFLPRKAGPADP